MIDKDLRNAVLEELDWEPSVEAADIAVIVDDGVVTLSGHVPNYAQKLTAESVARRVKGVRAIVQQIEVKPAGANPDEELARRAVDLIDWNVTVPHGAVTVKVAKGYVTLNGEVEWEFQRRAAEESLRRLDGVRGVFNAVTLKNKIQPADLRKRIEDALDRYADVEASHVHVDVGDGKVVLSGKVKSWAEHDVVHKAIWAAPGVRFLEDHVTVG